MGGAISSGCQTAKQDDLFSAKHFAKSRGVPGMLMRCGKFWSAGPAVRGTLSCMWTSRLHLFLSRHFVYTLPFNTF